MDNISNKRIVIDIDDTLSVTYNGDYKNSIPVIPVVETLRKYKDAGYIITLFSARNMRTHNRDIGKINVHTLPLIMDFLKKYDIPYDEIIMGKPWAGKGGFYVDDRAIRPSEFVTLSEDEINTLLDKEKEFAKENV